MLVSKTSPTPKRDPSRLVTTINTALEIVGMDDDSIEDLFQLIDNESETFFVTYQDKS